MITSLLQVVNRLDVSWLSGLFIHKLDVSCFNCNEALLFQDFKYFLFYFNTNPLKLSNTKLQVYEIALSLWSPLTLKYILQKSPTTLYETKRHFFTQQLRRSGCIRPDFHRLHTTWWSQQAWYNLLTRLHLVCGIFMCIEWLILCCFI